MVDDKQDQKDATVPAVTPGADPTPEQLDNPSTVDVVKDSNDPDKVGQDPSVQDTEKAKAQLDAEAARDAGKKPKAKKEATRSIKVPSEASSEHFGVVVKEAPSGVPIVSIHKIGSVADNYEVAVSQLDELVELLGKL